MKFKTVFDVRHSVGLIKHCENTLHFVSLCEQDFLTERLTLASTEVQSTIRIADSNRISKSDILYPMPRF